MLMVVHKFRDWVLEGWVSKYNLSMFDSSSQPENLQNFAVELLHLFGGGGGA